VLRIWGRLSSINVRKVVWAAQELGLAFERTDAGGSFGIVRQPEYLRMNPNALVPLIDDDGFQLWESNVIVRYLCARHDATGLLYPAALDQRFDAERWMDWQQTTLNPAGRDAFIQWIRTTEAQRQPELIARSCATTEPLLDMLDAQLARHAYLAGPRFTMADIPVACEIHRWWGLPQPRQPRPHLERWYRQVSARAGARDVLNQPLA
jgi:glutathione S-transferase